MSARLITWLDRYGSDLSQWPWPAALWVRVQVCCSAQARRLWSEACQQEQQLQQAFHPSALAAPLQQRLQAIPHNHRPLPSLPTGVNEWRWLPLSMALSCGVTGLLIGAVLIPVAPENPDTLAQLSMALVQLLSQPGAEL